MRQNRRQSREAAIQILYSMHFTGSDRHEASTLVGSVDGEDVQTPDEFSTRLLAALEAHAREVDETLVRALKNWTLDRVSAPDRAMLRLGVTEILFIDDVPGKVAVNEYIELAKEFGDDDSPKFINGVLDRVLKEHEAAGGATASAPPKARPATGGPKRGGS